jgi:hypothetical protein
MVVLGERPQTLIRLLGLGKFQNKGVTFPDDTLVLGKYLGPIIDVGPVMTQCVVEANGEVKDCLTV